MRLTVLQKGLVLATVPLLFQLAFVFLLAWVQRDSVAAERRAAHTKDVISQAQEIYTLVSDAQAGVRGHVISQKPEFAEPYRKATRVLPGRFDELRALVSDNPGQTEKARAVQAAAEASLAWQGGVDQLVVAGAGADAADRIRTGKGKELMDSFRREMAEFIAEEERLDRERSAALDRSRGHLNVLLAAGGFLTILCTLLVAYAFRRGITQRFAVLEANAGRLAAGESLLQPLAGGDEIARVDQAFRDMAAKLTRAAEEVRDLYDNAPCGYHSVDPDGTVVAINHTELQWLGYDAAEVVGRKRFVEMVSPASRDAYRAGFASVREHGSVHDVELELVRKDGTTFPILLNSSAIRDAEGRYLRSRTTLVDMTERKRAEDEVRQLNADLTRRLTELNRSSEALRVSEDQLRLLVEGARDYSVVMLDPEGRVAAWNAGAQRLKGYSADEIIGRHFSVFYPPEVVERGWPEEELRRAAAAGWYEDEGWRVRKDGSRFWANVMVVAIRDRTGKLLSFGKLTRDMTERKRAEDEIRQLNAELAERIEQRTGELAEANAQLRRELAERKRAEAAMRASDARIRAIVETAVDGIITIDERGTVETVNPAAERMFGYAAAEMIGRNVNALMPDPFRREHDGYLANYLRTGERKIIGLGREVRGLRKDGTVFPADLAVSETLLGDRRIFTGIVRDITDRKQSAEELRRAVVELADANRDLTQKNAENEMFVYSVSHDLRSPLVNLQGFSRELEKACRGLADVLTEESVTPEVRKKGQALLEGKVTKSVGFIQSAVMRLGNIIDALLRLSRAGRVEYRWEAVDVGQVVSQVVRAAQGTITEKGATVEVGELPPARGDRTAVEQLFGNLVGNALTYLDPARPGIIQIGVLPDESGGSRTYFVRDNGLGIAEGHRQKIFQAFQRAHPGVGSGEGLGLAIVSRIAERHRGRVWVESKPGEGSTFFVTLPAAHAAGDHL
jgi:PAS domain S-box-containing protein